MSTKARERIVNNAPLKNVREYLALYKKILEKENSDFST